MFVIIYPNVEGGIAVIRPAAGCGLSLEEIASKDVPANTPYSIIPASDIPTDRTFRAAWTADFSTPSGYGIGAAAWFAAQAAAQVQESSE